MSGKADCKRALQDRLGLESADESPLIGIIARLAEQKGMDIVADAVDEIMALGVQIVILGTGEERFHRLLPPLAERYPGRFHVTLRFDEDLARSIYAGTDMFIVPSRFEPCGLTQMYALKYGSVPIVRQTGGLADTVVDAIQAGGTGFVFVEPEPEELLEAVARAVRCFRDDKPRWREIVSRGMAENFSWEVAAGRYTDLYELAVRRRRGPDPYQAL
jgi:starch synthase